MNNIINEKINCARKFFEIRDFPGNFFDLINNTENMLEKYNILIFKENLGKVSGFIGYTNTNVAIICINYNRSLGHQNFTLAHEIGHLFLHHGESISDIDKNLYSRENIEDEANNFANEILYPNSLFEEDYKNLKINNLLDLDKRKELAEEINRICHIYCISFDFVLRKILYRDRQVKKFKNVRKEIEKSLGCVISKYFDHDFYVVNEENRWYKSNEKPYEILKEYVKNLYNNKKISLATAESILLKYGMEVE